VCQKYPELVKEYGGGSFGDGVVKPSTGYADVEGNEVVEDWECVESCPVRKLGEQSGESVSTGGRTIKRSGGGNVGSHKESEKWWTNENPSFGDTSTAARYFHIVKELELYDTESD